MAKAKKSGKTRAGARPRDAIRGAREPRATPRTLRIVGGRHRGRKLQFPAGVELRPTPDRVRETLFNWLQPRIIGARVLDLFAGSGALGLEALSRGAAHVTFVERDRRASESIATLLRDWNEPNAAVVCADALAWLGMPGAQPAFDIVFLDPPFDSPLLAAAAAALAGRLASGARIYVERRARDPDPALPASWIEARAGRAGEVGYHLYAS